MALTQAPLIRQPYTFTLNNIYSESCSRGNVTLLVFDTSCKSCSTFNRSLHLSAKSSSFFSGNNFNFFPVSHKLSKDQPKTIRSEVDTTEDAPAKAKKIRPGESKGFIEEMRIRAMKLHTKDQSKEGEKEAQKPLAKWTPTVQGYVQFLVDSKLVYDTMEAIVAKASHPLYSKFRDTGLERSAALAEDLAWFKSQGHVIPEPDTVGLEYSKYLSDISESDPPSFICHYYNVYFAHSAGGKMIGRKVSEMILDGRELQFYKWKGELSELLSAVKDTVNVVSQEWTRDEKDRCLKETELSFKYSGSILRLLVQ